MPEDISKENGESEDITSPKVTDLGHQETDLKKNVLSASDGFEFSQSGSVWNPKSRTMKSVEVNSVRELKNKKKTNNRKKLSVVTENTNPKKTFLKINCDIVSGRVSGQEYVRSLEKSSRTCPFPL